MDGVAASWRSAVDHGGVSKNGAIAAKDGWRHGRGVASREKHRASASEIAGEE